MTPTDRVEKVKEWFKKPHGTYEERDDLNGLLYYEFEDGDFREYGYDGKTLIFEYNNMNHEIEFMNIIPTRIK